MEFGAKAPRPVTMVEISQRDVPPSLSLHCQAAASESQTKCWIYCTLRENILVGPR